VLQLAACHPVRADYSLVRISPHAERQMTKRLMPETVVRAVLANPDRVLPGDRLGRRVSQATAMVGDPPFRTLLRVVVDDLDSPPSVVTVHATTQSRRYGAEP
jgi:Domain of unknown function (DUF4258)